MPIGAETTHPLSKKSQGTQSISFTGSTIAPSTSESEFADNGKGGYNVPVSKSQRPFLSGQRLPSVTKSMREVFLSKILGDLSAMQPHGGRSASAVYVNNLFANMGKMQDLLPNDVCTQIIATIHNALIFDNTWTKVTPEQIQRTIRLIEEIRGTDRTEWDYYARYVNRIKALGFSIIPFAFTCDEIEDDED